ncbi:plasmid mobilization protein [Paraburkholderia phenoliruptrix]|uniref:plasmid mobilization protein n=1 Tax=Paraburkholderia phenoliruptrix TaxID=252970 RepID=UPI0034CF5FDC
MTKPSERIVVFVTPAQKRAISATADELGISVSELMRRAVLSFGATSEQVKAASIVDRLNAPRAPDALDAALQRLAHDTAHARTSLPAALQSRAGSDAGAALQANEHAGNALADAAGGTDGRAMRRSTTSAVKAPADSIPPPAPATPAAPLLPADVLAALTAEVDEDAVATAEAVARIAAARAAAAEETAPAALGTRAHVKSVLKRPRLDTVRDDDDTEGDLGPEGGRFA